MDGDPSDEDPCGEGDPSDGDPWDEGDLLESDSSGEDRVVGALTTVFKVEPDLGKVDGSVSFIIVVRCGFGSVGGGVFFGVDPSGLGVGDSKPVGTWGLDVGDPKPVGSWGFNVGDPKPDPTGLDVGDDPGPRFGKGGFLSYAQESCL